MANTDIMIDLETLNTTPDSTILTIGAVKFDPFGSEIKEPKMDSFYVKVDLDSCDRIGLTTNDDTIAWWANQLKMHLHNCINFVGVLNVFGAMDRALTLLFANMCSVKLARQFLGVSGKCVMYAPHLILASIRNALQLLHTTHWKMHGIKQ